MKIKKIFNLIIISVFLVTPTLAVQEKATIQNNAILAPKWSEFCPEEYLSAYIIPEFQIHMKAREYCDSYCSSSKKWMRVINAITVLPALMCAASESYWVNQIRKENEIITYWYERKKLFDAAIATCMSAPREQQATCYMQVRQLELQRKQIALQDIQIQVQNMNAMNQSMQMMNINNSIQNLNRHYGY